ncbi:MAG: hypothetical protein P1U36_03045 [Legionellaceae bacterium]|nr:hypothetical protein [Legionellaceae bacterium]
MYSLKKLLSAINEQNNALVEKIIKYVPNLVNETLSPDTWHNFNAHTPLLEAVMVGNIEILKTISKHVANIDMQHWHDDPAHGKSALAYVIEHDDEFPPLNRIEIIRTLLAHGASPNFQSESVFTPLIAASINRDYGIMKLLLEHGANPNTPSADGATPILCCLFGSDEIYLDNFDQETEQNIKHCLTLLLSFHSEKPNLGDEEADHFNRFKSIWEDFRYSPCHITISMTMDLSDTTLIDSIHQHGFFCLSHKDNQDKKPLDVARSQRNIRAIEILENAGKVSDRTTHIGQGLNAKHPNLTSTIKNLPENTLTYLIQYLNPQEITHFTTALCISADRIQEGEEARHAVTQQLSLQQRCV